MITKDIHDGSKNFVFIGEAGGGKSEISLNFAKWLNTLDKKQVDFFDMDMTKPLFRSRDVSGDMRREGIIFHYEEQFMDVPTLVGGISRALKDERRYVVLDVGGDYIGARAIGGFTPLLRRDNTKIYYVLNAFRPWSHDIEHIDHTLSQILASSHIELDSIYMINNTNNGPTTTKDEFISGSKKLIESLSPYAAIAFSCISEDIYEQARPEWDGPLFPLSLNLKYPWQ